MEIRMLTIFYGAFLFYEVIANPCHTPTDADTPIKINYTDPVKKAIQCFIFMSEEKTDSLITYSEDRRKKKYYHINKPKAQDICREYKATLPIFEHNDIAQFFHQMVQKTMATNNLAPDKNQVYALVGLTVNKKPDAAGMLEVTWDNGFQIRLPKESPYGIYGSWEFGSDQSVTTLSDRGDFDTYNNYSYKGDVINTRVYFFCHYDPLGHRVTTTTITTETSSTSTESEFETTTTEESIIDSSEMPQQLTTSLDSATTSPSNASPHRFSETIVVRNVYVLKLILIHVASYFCKKLLIDA